MNCYIVNTEVPPYIFTTVKHFLFQFITTYSTALLLSTIYVESNI